MCFVVYLISLVFLLFIFDRAPYEGYRYNIVPFTEIKRYMYLFRDGNYEIYAIMNLFGNLILFMPFGFFIPALFHKKYLLIRVILHSFFLSVSVELIQLISRVGSFDIDDIILNTIGGIVGFIVYIIIRSIYRLIRFGTVKGDMSLTGNKED